MIGTGLARTPEAGRPAPSHHPLHRLFHPRSVAIVGASADVGRLTARPLRILEHHGYQGRIHLVNPARTSIGERPCHASVAELGEPVDVAVVLTAAATVPAILADCGRRGIPNAVVIASGFEDAEDGATLTEALRSAADVHGVNVVGPNSEGLWSVPDRALLTFGSAALRDELVEGPVSVISQSGGLGAAVVRALSDRGVGCRYFVSAGNETILGTAEYLDYVLCEGGTRTVVLFLEAIGDPRMVGLLEEAREQGVRVVLLRAGRTREGRLATATHTGRMASGARAYGDVLRACGVVEVDSLDDLVAAAEAVTVAPPSVPGPRGGVAVVSVSGGCRALVVDALATHGLPLARFAPETEAGLADVLPRFGHARNPVDVTGAVLTDRALLREVLERIAGDASSGAILIQLAGGASARMERHEEELGAFARRVGRPVVIGLLAEDPPAGVRDRLRAAGAVISRDPTSAVAALAWIAGPGRPGNAPAPHAAPAAPRVPGPRAPQAIDPDDPEAAALVVREIGAHPPALVHLAAGDDPVEHCARLREPLVAKAPDGYVEHRTEHGLVRLDLRGEAALTDAVAALRSVLGDVPVVVQEQVPGVEVLLSATRHPDLGPVLAVGSGGIRTELLDDVAFVPLPASSGEVMGALGRTRVHDLLVPYRGRPGADIDALTACAARLGDLLLASPQLDAVELNPLLVHEHGCTAVDVLLVAGGRS